MNLLNHYSALLLLSLIAAAGLAVYRRRGRQPRDAMRLALLLLALVIGWMLWRPVASSSTPTSALPVLLEVQSPYCLGCIAMRTRVDHVERQWAGKLAVRRVNIQSEEGRQLARQHHVEITPTFLLFDAAGREQWRGVGRLDEENIRALLEPAP